MTMNENEIDESLFRESSHREKVLEHLFIGDLLRCLWCKGLRDIEVLRVEVDRGGYDLVLEHNNITRHIQLKSSHSNGKRSTINVNINLAHKPSGCIVWIWFNPDTMQLGPFSWFGGLPGQPMPLLGDKIGKHTKGNKDGHKAERPNIRIIKKNQFKQLASMDEIIVELFGPKAP